MERVDTLVLRIRSTSDGEYEELTEATQRLRTVLLHLDVGSVEPMPETNVPGLFGPGTRFAD